MKDYFAGNLRLHKLTFFYETTPVFNENKSAPLRQQLAWKNYIAESSQIEKLNNCVGHINAHFFLS